MTATSSGAEGTLSRTIGLRQVVFQSVSQMAPGASVVFGVGVIILYSGPAAPFSLIIAFAAAVLLSIGLGALASRIPSAGGFYSYTSVAFGKQISYLLGWLYIPMYFLFICCNALSWGLISKDFLAQYFSINAPVWVVIGLLIVLVASLSYVGLRASTNVTMVLSIAEVIIIFVVAVLLIIHAGSHNTLSAFNPGRATGANPSHFQAIFLGTVYAVSLMIGFESAAPLAEETSDPPRSIPRAMIGSAVVIGLFYIFTLYASVVAWPGKLSNFYSSADPWYTMAHILGGFFGFIILVAILNSLVGVCVAGFNSQSRILFAAGRARVAPRWLSRSHERHHTPYLAVLFIAGSCVVGTFVASEVFHGAYNGFIFFLTIATIIYLIEYLAVALACIVFFTVKDRTDLNIWKHVVAPGLACVLFAPALWYSMKGLTYPADDAIPVFIVWAVLGVIALVVMYVRHVEIGSEEERWLAQAVHRPDSVEVKEAVPVAD